MLLSDNHISGNNPITMHTEVSGSEIQQNKQPHTKDDNLQDVSQMLQETLFCALEHFQGQSNISNTGSQ